MKPFDLQEALNGAPVKLQDGTKAFVLHKLNTKSEECLMGYYIDQYGWHYQLSWRENGRSELDQIDDANIVGMWEEPELTSEQVLEKAYQENLPLDAIGKKAFVIAKTKDGDYVMQCGEDNLYFASHETEWKFYKDPAPKSDTITVTLPKPFKPKEGEVYYSIGGYHNGTIVKMHANCMTDISILSGNCFRVESDARAWLDAMKNALDD